MIGTFAGAFGCCTATDNVFIGAYAGRANNYGASGCTLIAGCFNNVIGKNAGKYMTSGNTNNFFGYRAGYCNRGGCSNNFIGYSAGAACLNTGSYNNFIGFRAGFCNTSGKNNTFIGRNAGCCNNTGANNIMIGNGVNMNTAGLSGVIVLGTDALASASNTLVLGSATTRLSAVPATTLTNQVSSLIVILNGTSLRIPILSGP